MRGGGGTKISVTYHLNIQNIDEYKHIYQLCTELDINLSALASSLFPDYVLDLCEGNEICESAKLARDLMLFSLEKRLDVAKNEKSEKCMVTYCFPHIAVDGSVKTCISFFNETDKLADNYLSIALEDLMERKNNCTLCMRCLKHSIHRYVWTEERPEYCENIIKERWGLPSYR